MLAQYSEQKGQISFEVPTENIIIISIKSMNRNQRLISGLVPLHWSTSRVSQSDICYEIKKYSVFPIPPVFE
jgi:hypothetical protein